MTVVSGDGKHTWVDFEMVTQPTRASFWSDLMCLTLTETSVWFQPEQTWRCSSLYTASTLASKFVPQVGGWQKPHQTDCLLLRWPRTIANKSVFSRDQGPAPALSDQPREKGKAQSAGQGPLERWKDNSTLPPPVSLDLMRRQTICEWWHGQIGPKGYEWETSKPAHVSANVKGFV